MFEQKSKSMGPIFSSENGDYQGGITALTE